MDQDLIGGLLSISVHSVHLNRWRLETSDALLGICHCELSSQRLRGFVESLELIGIFALRPNNLLNHFLGAFRKKEVTFKRARAKIGFFSLNVLSSASLVNTVMDGEKYGLISLIMSASFAFAETIAGLSSFCITRKLHL